MKNLLYIIKSSFYDYEGGAPATTAWRLLFSSLACVLDGSGNNTGVVHGTTLEEFTIATGVATGVTKANTPTDPNHIADYSDITMCPITVAPVDSSAELYSNRGAPADAVLDNHDGVHSYSMLGVDGDSIIPIVPGTYDVTVTPNAGGSPHARIIVNGGAPVIIAAGATQVFHGIVAPLTIYVYLEP